MNYITFSIDDRRANRLIGKKVPGIVDVLPQVLKKNLNRARDKAKEVIPFERGIAQKGILKPKIERTPRGAKAYFIWVEFDRDRQKRFNWSRTKYENFGEWLNHSPSATSEWNWKNGKNPEFMKAAKQNSKAHLRTDLKEAIDRKLKNN